MFVRYPVPPPHRALPCPPSKAVLQGLDPSRAGGQRGEGGGGREGTGVGVHFHLQPERGVAWRGVARRGGARRGAMATRQKLSLRHLPHAPLLPLFRYRKVKRETVQAKRHQPSGKRATREKKEKHSTQQRRSIVLSGTRLSNRE